MGCIPPPSLLLCLHQQHPIPLGLQLPSSGSSLGLHWNQLTPDHEGWFCSCPILLCSAISHWWLKLWWVHPHLRNCNLSSNRKVKVKGCSVVSNSLRPHGLQPIRILCPWNSPGKNTGVGCHFLFQGIFWTSGSNPCLLHCRQILYHLSHQGSFFQQRATRNIHQHISVALPGALVAAPPPFVPPV